MNGIITKFRALWIRKDKDWHREAIGGRWDEIGQLQFEYIKSQGLKSNHHLLDIGCGSLRGGIHFIRYLNQGNYYGIEKERALIQAGRTIELKKHDLEDKRPVLSNIEDFDLSSIDQPRFDFMIAQSVFTHLPPDLIELCLSRVVPRLAHDGYFFATFNEGKKIDLGLAHVWRSNERGVTRYPVSMFDEISGRVGVNCRYIGDWGHPGNSTGNQKMLCFSAQ